MHSCIILKLPFCATPSRRPAGPGARRSVRGVYRIRVRGRDGSRDGSRMLLMPPLLLMLLFGGSAAQGFHQPAAQIADGPTKPTRPAPSPPSASGGPLLPPWPPTYDMQSSTILQPSNADGAWS